MGQGRRPEDDGITVRVRVDRARYRRFRRWARARGLEPASAYLGFLLDAAMESDDRDYRFPDDGRSGLGRPGRPKEV